MDNDHLDFFSYLLSHDLLNNISDRNELLNGIAIPSPYLSNNIFTRDDDIIFQGESLKN